MIKKYINEVWKSEEMKMRKKDKKKKMRDENSLKD